jgi:3-methyladenine DNA glycosylase AlkD
VTRKTAPSNAKAKAAPREAGKTHTAGGAPAVLAALEARASKRTLAGMARYAIPAERAWGVSVADIRALAKGIGRDHRLAAELWKSGVYEARMLAAFVDEPALVTVAQMDRWCRDFDSWALCDTLCFHLFDRTPHAFGRVAAWVGDERELVKRAGFALLAALAGHDRSSEDVRFADCLPFVERGASDGRNFVKKGVSWALRGIGHRSAGLHTAAIDLAQRLAGSPDAAPRWVGKDVLRDLSRPSVTKRFTAPRRSRAAGA